MIKIRKYNGGEIFDLPKDYIIEVEKTNPMFENKGSQTVSINFPVTNQNKRLLNFPHRLDNHTRPQQIMPVILEVGSLHQKGQLNISSASQKGISAAIGFDEADMYAQLGTIKLKEIKNLPVVNFSGSTREQKVVNCIAHLQQVMEEIVKSDYQIFPLILQETKNNNTVYYEILNILKRWTSEGYNADGLYVEFWNKDIYPKTIQRYDGTKVFNVEIPIGYGISPFLKIWRVLELIFENFGYEIIENPFKTHIQLEMLVCLNNTIDTIVTGKIEYKALMPDITIQEFLDGLYNKYGMLFFIDSNLKQVRLKLLDDISNPQKDVVNLTEFRSSHPTISFSKPKQVRLKANREIAGTELLDGIDTYEELLQQANFQIAENNPFFNTGSNVYRTSYYFNRQISQYEKSVVFNTESNMYVNSFLNVFSNKILYGSDFFDWDKKTPNIEYEEFEQKDLCLPLFHNNIAIVGQISVVMKYLVGYQSLYSDFVVKGQTQAETTNPAKLAFAFAFGDSNYYPENNIHQRYCFASQINRDIVGNFIYKNGKRMDISLTNNREDGLYNRFFKKYDDFLRHSNNEVTQDFYLSDKQKFETKTFQKFFVDNQPFLLKQLKYKLNKAGALSSATFLTLAKYKPYNLNFEQVYLQNDVYAQSAFLNQNIIKEKCLINVYQQQKYRWVLTSSNSGAVFENYQYHKFFKDNYFTKDGVKIYFDSDAPLPVPMQTDYQNGSTIVYEYKISNANSPDANFSPTLNITNRTETYKVSPANPN